MHTSLLGPVPLLEGRTDHIVSLGDYYLERRALLSRVDWEYVDRAGGLDVNLGTHRYEVQPASVEVSLGGSLVVARPERPASGLGGRPEGGLRGEVLGFSSASRRRLMRLIAATKRDIRPLFITLTYPDVFPGDIAKWKRDLDVFGKRLLRAFPDAGFVWRIEFKSRLSGKSKGIIAPHFHLLLWGPSIVDFRKFGDVAWYKTVGSGDVAHRRAGVSSERIRQWRGTIHYVAKYIAKQQAFPENWTGRVWGVVGRKNVPWAVKVVIELTRDDGIKLIRLGRRLCRIKGQSFPLGLTFIANSERVLDYLEFLIGFT